MSAEASLKQSFYAVGEARSYFYPSLTLSGSVGWTNSAGAVISNPGALLWQAVGSLTQPLFNQGRNKARLKIAKAQQEEARLVFQQTLLNAGAEVNNALTLYQSAREKTAVYDKQIKLLESATHSTRLLMRHGSTTYLEVLTAQQTLLQAQLLQTANRLDEMQGIINLYRALGGGR
jgi:outer membrane protein TolC